MFYDGCTLNIVSPDGELLETIDLGDYDLSKGFASAVLIGQIKDALDSYQRWHSYDYAD